MEKRFAEKIIGRKLDEKEWRKVEKLEFSDAYNYLNCHRRIELKE